jgi:repressor LexA
MDGDYVVVRQQPDAQNGVIVVAMMDDFATVSVFTRKTVSSAFSLKILP